MGLEVSNQDNQYKWADFSTKEGLPVAQLRDTDLGTADISDTDRVKLQSLKDNKSFMAAGGILVKGTPWNRGYKDKDGNPDETIRVFFSHEEYDEFAKKLTQECVEAHKKEPFAAVVTLPTGGVALGSKIAGETGLPLHYLHATAYDANGDKGELSYSEEEIDAICKGCSPGSRILLVDDLSDSGQALAKTKAAFEARGMVVVTAAIFAKEGTEHVPDICLYPKYPKLWIVQPSEMKEGLVSGHNVHNIQDHPITQQIKDISRRVGALVEGYDDIRTIQFVAPEGTPGDLSQIMMTVAKMHKSYWDIAIQFVAQIPEDISEFKQLEYEDATGLQYRVKSGVLTIMLDVANQGTYATAS